MNIEELKEKVMDAIGNKFSTQAIVNDLFLLFEASNINLKENEKIIPESEYYIHKEIDIIKINIENLQEFKVKYSELFNFYRESRQETQELWEKSNDKINEMKKQIEELQDKNESQIKFNEVIFKDTQNSLLKDNEQDKNIAELNESVIYLMKQKDNHKLKQRYFYKRLERGGFEIHDTNQYSNASSSIIAKCDISEIANRIVNSLNATEN